MVFGNMHYLSEKLVIMVSAICPMLGVQFGSKHSKVKSEQQKLVD